MFAAEGPVDEHSPSSIDPSSSQSSPEPSESFPEHWDLVISPQVGFLPFHLAEIWRYRDLLRLFVRRDIVAFYKQTILGPVWVLLQPLLTSLIYLLVFHRIAGLSTDSLPPILFYLVGVSCWGFFSECLSKTSETFIANAQLYEKVYFPRLITPISLTISGLIRFVIQLALVFVIWLWYLSKGLIEPGWDFVLLPFLILLVAGTAMGMGLILSSLTAKYRDLRFLLQFGIQLLMFATPVIYPLSIAGESTQRLILLNPLTAIFEAFRHACLGRGELSTLGLGWSALFSVIVLLCGIVIFNRTERTFIDTV